MIKINTEKLNELMADFYLLTNIRMAIFDGDFQEIACYPPELCDFCRIIKSNPAAKSQCNQSDRESCQICKSTRSIYTYQCHAGLLETVAPLKYDHSVIGYVMFGQILENKNDSVSSEQIRAKAEEYHINPEELLPAFQKLKHFSTTQIKAVSKILEACASYLWLEELISLDKNNLAIRIDQYITQNLSGNLAVEKMCEDLQISRSTLYQVFRQTYNIGIAEYVRNKRINLAKHLLKTTNYQISLISQLVGIPDYNHFTKIFKKQVSMTPRDYRKKHNQ